MKPKKTMTRMYMCIDADTMFDLKMLALKMRHQKTPGCNVSSLVRMAIKDLLKNKPNIDKFKEFINED